MKNEKFPRKKGSPIKRVSNKLTIQQFVKLLGPSCNLYDVLALLVHLCRSSEPHGHEFGRLFNNLVRLCLAYTLYQNKGFLRCVCNCLHRVEPALLQFLDVC